MATPKLKITYKKLEALKPYEKNARTHSDAQVAQIVASVKEFGWTNPIILDGDNGILAGHGRLMAAKALGLSEVPTVDLVGLTPEQKRAYVLADNKLAMNAGWDMELLKHELLELDHLNYDLGLIGWDEKELEGLFAPIGDLEDDKSINDDSRFLVIIECPTENEQQQVFSEMTERGLECKLMS